ncbi:DGQHR domain-containing protein DpdB [Roseomonas indoligenes]|uniref:DGQHR domain-containing protein n=1 Tax=Roseomonas indoligenes TaxID=2820811 RepID=A0A940N1K7_9PROT|nr:DGQHR domain-containing protein DpdB [Pararoseomonas indoligenes]MBP0496266.1 DGQHR domain-containing protein [Pararoseomonas indoligenes]
MRQILQYDVIVPRQAEGMPVFTFAARAEDVARIARIERAGRDKEGALQGFQRPQIAGHIREIRDYLEKPNSILPNPIVIAFTGGATLEPLLGPDGSRRARLTIDASNGPPGWIVDGQQRFTALKDVRSRDLEVLVSGFICPTEEELQKQFILINNTRPLPKALVYELLPQVSDLPHRMSSRSQAALATEALNYRAGSSLRSLIRQQTNPKGIIRDTVLQRVIMNSITDGALRLYADDNRLLLERGVLLISEFYHAVRHVFAVDWDGHSPKTSRLVHGAGIIAMGYVMEQLHVTSGAEDREAFARGLAVLRGRTAWTSGEWEFGSERRRWNGIQNVPADIRQLSMHLVAVLRRGAQQREAA